MLRYFVVLLILLLSSTALAQEGGPIGGNVGGIGTSIGTGLLLDSTTLKVSAILQEYHAVDPTAAGLTVNQLDDEDIDYIAFWDDSATAFQPLVLGDNLSITGTILSAASVVSWPSGTAGDLLYSNGESDPAFGSYLDIPILTAAPGSPSAGRIYGADNDNWDPADLAGTADYYVIYDGADYILWMDEDGNQYFSSIDMSNGSINIPNGTADAALTSAGQINFNTTDEQVSFHSAADGEISGEVALSLLYKKCISFDPVAVYSTTLHRIMFDEIGPDAPEGITYDKWTFTFDADPTAEIDADFKRADAFIGVANAAVIDALDTTAGYSSEDTDANINSGAVVATGKVTYIEISASYTETGHTCTFCAWWHNEED